MFVLVDIAYDAFFEHMLFYTGYMSFINWNWIVPEEKVMQDLVSFGVESSCHHVHFLSNLFSVRARLKWLSVSKVTQFDDCVIYQDLHC